MLNRKQKAFTLIELVACLSIIGIVSLAVTPKLFSSQHLEVRLLTDEIIHFLHSARRYAQQTECPVKLLFYNDFWVLKRPVNRQACLNASPQFIHELPGYVSRLDINRKVGVDTHSSDVIFDHQGQVSVDIVMEIGQLNRVHLHKGSGIVSVSKL